MGTRRKHRHLAALAVAALTVFGVVIPTAIAHAFEPPEVMEQLAATTLPGTIGTMVVDAATHHVYASVPASNSVVVFDEDGTLVQTIGNEAGAQGLALVGDRLYVVAANAGAIDEIDTATLTRSRTVVSGIAGMRDVVAAAGSLWVTSMSRTAQVTLLRVSTIDGTTTPFTNVLGFYVNGLVGNPADAAQLFAYTPSTSPVTIVRVDLSVTPPVAAANSTLVSPTISNVQDLAVSPDGTRLIPSGGAPYEFDELRTSDFSADGVVYPANPYPTAVEIGAGLMVGGMNGLYATDVLVYPYGDPNRTLGSYNFANDQAVEKAGLAIAPDGSRVFVATGDGSNAMFRVLSVPGHGTTTTSTSSTSSSTTTSTTTAPALTRTQSVPSLQISPSGGSFGAQRVGTYGEGITFTLRNTSGATVTLEDMTVGGTNPADFFGATNCGHTLATGSSCRAELYFAPLHAGARRANFVVIDNTAGSPHRMAINGTGTEGYFIGGAHGQVANFGDAIYHGDATKLALHAPIVSLRTTPTGAGYWLLGRDGGIFSFGNAHFYGSTGNLVLRQPVLGMTPTLDGKGYWLVASDGGIFAFGNAHFYGSTGNLVLRQPIVGMATTPTGRGYWLVASDGGIFAFGDARFYGSTGNLTLRKPIVGMAATPSGRGYWLVASDGGIFAFGDAHFYGAPSGSSDRVVGIASTPTGHGYWTLTNTGRVGHFGDAPFYGDVASVGATDVIGIAPTAPLLPPELLGYHRAALSSASSPSPSSMPHGLGTHPAVAHTTER